MNLLHDNSLYRSFRLTILTAWALFILGASTMLADELNQPWTGDLDGMIERRFIRALVPYNKTIFSWTKAASMGRPTNC